MPRALLTCVALSLFLFLATGCRASYRYHYTGVLRRGNELSALPGARVVVAPGAPTDPANPGSEAGDSLRRRSTTTDGAGSYSGRFSTPAPDEPRPSEPPELPRVGLWVLRGTSWEYIVVPLPHDAQAITSHDVREIIIPPVVVPADPSKPMRTGE